MSVKLHNMLPIKALKYIDPWIYKFVILYSIVLIPFIVVSIYNNPSTDDFWVTNKVIQLGFFKAQLWWYNNWTGRFSTLLLLSVNPLIYNSFGLYKLFSIIIILLLIFISYSFIHASLNFVSIKDKVTIHFFLTFIYFYQMPSIMEGVYWMTPVICYQIANIYILTFLTLIIYYKKNKKKIIKAFIFFILMILCLLIVGSNEISIMIFILILLFINLYEYLNKKKVNWNLFLLLLLSILGTVIVVLSPGNKIRSEFFPEKQQLLKSVYYSVNLILDYLSKWFFIILIFTMLFIDTFIRVAKEINLKYPYLKISVKFLEIYLFVLFFIICVAEFIGFWSMGSDLPPRAMNELHFFFVINIIILIILFSLCYLKSRIALPQIKKPILLLTFIILYMLSFKPNNIRTVYYDLLSGKAYNYDNEMKKRYNKILKSESKIVIVDPIIVQPKTLWRADLSYDTTNWINREYSRYFHKQRISLNE